MIDLTPLKGKTILVVGGDGFLGYNILEQLHTLTDSFPCQSSGDYTDYGVVLEEFSLHNPDYIINCAGQNGGVGYQKPFDIFDLNTSIPLNILRAAAECKVKKVLLPVASCAYDGDLAEDGLLPSASFLRGRPHESVEAHGYAKRNTQLACKFARDQFGLCAVTVCPPTLFGPRDRYDPDRSKIMAGMVKRFADAADQGLSEVTCWGTGKPLREFLFVEDAALLLLQALLAYDDSSQPLNLGGQFEFSIKDVAEMVAEEAGYRGSIQWDKEKPDGQMRKRLNTGRMNEYLGHQEFSDFRESLRTTIAAYRKDRDAGKLR